MGQRVAVVGAGMTKFVRRAQETGKELAWQAARAALDSAEMTLDDIDCVAMGTAPDAFDGVHMKGEYLADCAGAWGKPYFRTYVDAVRWSPRRWDSERRGGVDEDRRALLAGRRSGREAAGAGRTPQGGGSG